MAIRLGVNIDHVATLRQVRGGTTPYPSMLEATGAAVRGGADQITIHLREDRRHIQDEDVELLAESCPVDLNLEMAVTDEMEKIALKFHPKYVCLVPEKRAELTTEGGLDIVKKLKRISKLTEKMSGENIGVSLFIGADSKQVKASAKSGAFAVEFHTGHWCDNLRKGKGEKDWRKLIDACELAHALGLKVHAGHGLDFGTAKQACILPHMRELNIGHSLVSYSVVMGLEEAVRKMKESFR
ncbi:MAG: pyridoxine 5'-phosphate synthase [Bdellovibrionia bacterium]